MKIPLCLSPTIVTFRINFSYVSNTKPTDKPTFHFRPVCFQEPCLHLSQTVTLEDGQFGLKQTTARLRVDESYRHRRLQNIRQYTARCWVTEQSHDYLHTSQEDLNFISNSQKQHISVSTKLVRAEVLMFMLFFIMFPGDMGILHKAQVTF